MRKKKLREYKSETLKALMLVVLVATFIAFFIASLEQDGVFHYIFAIILLPTIIKLIDTIIKAFFSVDTYTDVRIHSYCSMKASGIHDVWVPLGVNQEDITDCSFIGVTNIGETMITKLRIIINHNKEARNTNYVVPHPVSKGKTIYFAAPEVCHSFAGNVTSISVIHYSSGVDKGVQYSGSMLDIGEYSVFSEISTAGRNRKRTDIQCQRVGLSSGKSFDDSTNDKNIPEEMHHQHAGQV